MTVIDSQPDRRKAYELAQRFWGFVRLCFYGNNINGKQINEGQDDMEMCVTVDRTSWLDVTLGRFKNQTTTIPADAPLMYKNHVKALVRIYEKDKNNNPTGRYMNAKDDHWAHADNYAEIALPMAASMLDSQNMKSPV